MLRSFAFIAAAVSLCTAAEFDLVNARLVDGTGNPWRRSDVGVRDGRIAAVGRLAGAAAYRTVDAAGRVLARGFIDVHTHVEDGIERVPRGDNYILDGVTTIVTGNFSFGIFISPRFASLQFRDCSQFVR